MRKFNAEDTDAFEAWLKDSFQAGARAGMVSACARIVSDIVSRIIPSEPRIPVDRGVYRAGWQFEVTEEGADVYNATPQAPIIEWGARAENIKIGKTMIDALAEWVVRKGIASRAEARSVAWAIAKSMQKKGIFNANGKGLRILEKALVNAPMFIEEEVAREIGRALS